MAARVVDKKIFVNNFHASLVFRTMGYRLAIRGGLLLSDLCVGLGRTQFSTFYFTARVLCLPRVRAWSPRSPCVPLT